MLRTSKTLPTLLLAATFAAVGCHAQKPPTGSKLSPDEARRVEVLVRQKASLQPGSTIGVSPRTTGPFPGYDEIFVTVTSFEGTVSHPIDFLISTDGKTLVQFTRFDISANPRDLVSAVGRPWRGGPDSAPVLIVIFDDLECPYCARMHADMFPAVTDRYKDQVHVVYRDYPLEEIHPWALRAAIDTNCVAAQSNNGYWTTVDYVHAHAAEIGKTPASDKAPASTSLAAANDQLDKIARQQGEAQKVDMAKLNACLTKQDKTAIEQSKKLADTLNVGATPAIFINGDKIDGALPNEFIFKIIDQALIAEGKTPPPPYVAPAPPAPMPPPASPAPAPKK